MFALLLLACCVSTFRCMAWMHCFVPPDLNEFGNAVTLSVCVSFYIRKYKVKLLIVIIVISYSINYYCFFLSFGHCLLHFCFSFCGCLDFVFVFIVKY